MNTRLNGILTTLAQQYAYHLLAQAPGDASRIPFLADGLADSGVLVIIADIPANNYERLMRAWVDDYNRLYSTISSILFPSFTGANLGAADGMRPPVFVLQGESVAVIQMLAGYIVPYVAMRQQTTSISDAEIRGLMTYILEELAADDLEKREYDRLWRQCAQIIRQLITLPIRQYALTSMKRPLFQQNHIRPQQVPQQRSRPVPPRPPETGKLNQDRLKEDAPDRKPPKKDQNKTQPMPIWFNIEDDIDDTKPRPPVIWSPDDDDDK